jgi:mono/diheme cytochrome c family protein
MVLGLAGVAWIALQLTAPHRTNPVVDRTAALDAASTPTPVLRIFERSCYDCHSAETHWPWYAAVAPASWLVASDVNEGRGQLNFSRWKNYNVFDRADLLDKICEQVSNGTMPLWQYRLVHRGTRLSDTEIAAVCGWTEAEAARLTGAGS